MTGASPRHPNVNSMLKLRQLREQRSLSQAVLAKRAGVTVYTISRLENGRHRPTLLTLNKLAGALGVKPEDIATPQETAGVGARGHHGA